MFSIKTEKFNMDLDISMSDDGQTKEAKIGKQIKEKSKHSDVIKRR